MLQLVCAAHPHPCC